MRQQIILLKSFGEIVWQCPFKISTTVMGSVQRQKLIWRSDQEHPKSMSTTWAVIPGHCELEALSLEECSWFPLLQPCAQKRDSPQLHHTVQAGSWINPGNQSLNTLKEKMPHKITRFLQRCTQTQSCCISSLQTLRKMTVQEENQVNFKTLEMDMWFCWCFFQSKRVFHFMHLKRTDFRRVLIRELCLI